MVHGTRRMKGQENGESCTMRSFIFCTHSQISGRSHQTKESKLDGACGIHARGERKRTRFWCESEKKRDHLEDRGIDEMVSEWILGRQAGGDVTACRWFKI
jgi:hypothetical protein